MARETGTVKWFSNEKGYGFIEREDGEDVFVHHSDIRGEGFKTLREGERVRFEVIPADKGPKARDVERSEAAPARDAGEGGEGGAGSEAEAPDRSLASQLREKLGKKFFGGSETEGPSG